MIIRTQVSKNNIFVFLVENLLLNPWIGWSSSSLYEKNVFQSLDSIIYKILQMIGIKTFFIRVKFIAEFNGVFKNDVSARLKR